MSTTRSFPPRPAWRVARIAIAVAAGGLLSATVGAQATPAHAARATGLLDRRAHLRVRDVSIVDALGELEKSSGVPLAYSPSLLPRDRSLRCACDDVTIAQALEQLLATVPFTYRETYGQVVVVPMPRTNLRDADAKRLASVAPRRHRRSADGKYQAGIRMSFDRFDQDQVVVRNYSANNGDRQAGLRFRDRWSKPIIRGDNP